MFVGRVCTCWMTTKTLPSNIISTSWLTTATEQQKQPANKCSENISTPAGNGFLALIQHQTELDFINKKYWVFYFGRQPWTSWEDVLQSVYSMILIYSTKEKANFFPWPHIFKIIWNWCHFSKLFPLSHRWVKSFIKVKLNKAEIFCLFDI